MKRESKVRSRLTGLITLVAGSLLAHNALAVGTPAGTTVENTVSASYSVGGVAQDAVSSPTISFEVDHRVDFTLVELGGIATTVTPGQLNAVTTFQLTNLGNAPMDFDLQTANLVGGSVHGNADNENVDEDPPRVFVDTDGNGSYDGTETAVFVDELTDDDSAGLNVVTIFVVANIGTTGIDNGDVANVSLTAIAHDAGAAGLGAQTADDSGDLDDPNAVQIVFADAGLDGTETAEDGYLVESAALAVTKTSSVVADDVGSANPKAIPGATVQYEVTIVNSGPVGATAIGIIDPLDSNLTIALGEFAGNDAEYQVGGSAAVTCTLDADDGDTDGCGLFAGGTEVRVTQDAGIAVSDSGSAPANSVAIRFRATIN